MINKANEITAYTIVGSYNNGIECIIPEFVLKDNPQSYRYINNEFIKNPDYKPPEPPEITDVEQMAFDHEYRLSALELGI